MAGHQFKHHSKVVWPGFSSSPAPRQILKVGRNELCPCDSGKKYKDCHEKAGSTWLEKLGRERDRERMKEMRQQAKEQGVPWYKRLFMRG